MIKRFLNEPLLHFAVIAAALFLVHGSMRGPEAPGSETIVVTVGQVEHLAAVFARTWQRPPTSIEIAGLVRDWVREEVYYREAVALGLDRDDPIVRRRMRQKMEFVSEDPAVQLIPSETELSAYLNAHPETFRVDARYTFEHVYLNPDRRGKLLNDHALELLSKLRESGSELDVSKLGDPLLLEQRYERLLPGEVASLFGEQFAAALSELPARRWEGPVESAYGVHLVWIDERTDAVFPALSDVRDAVISEWRNTKRQEANERFYQKLLERYTVTIEHLDSDSVSRTAESSLQSGTSQ